METRNGRVSFAWEILHVITQVVMSRTKRITPFLNACQRVTSVIDSNISVRSIEREHRILAASRSAKRALLHRERETSFEF